MLYILTSNWVQGTPNAGQKLLFWCMFSGDFDAKFIKIRQKDQIFALFPNAGRHKNTSLAPKKTS